MSLEEILASMSSISLEEMSAVKLMNRTDTKYLLNRQTLLEIAQRWPGNFFVQEHENKRIANYKTLYFETADALTYTIHHNKHLKRQKVRQRIYVDSNLCFLEIKTKLNTGRTHKKRIEIPLNEFGLLYDAPAQKEFVQNRFWVTQEPLSPRLQNAFQRITLVNKQKTERITIDSGIHFHNLVNLSDADVSELVIAEVKQDGNCPSDFKRLLQEARVPQKGISKYCLGMLLTDEHIKYNRFKPKIRYISKLIDRKLRIKAANIN